MLHYGIVVDELPHSRLLAYNILFVLLGPSGSSNNDHDDQQGSLLPCETLPSQRYSP